MSKNLDPKQGVIIMMKKLFMVIALILMVSSVCLIVLKREAYENALFLFAFGLYLLWIRSEKKNES